MPSPQLRPELYMVWFVYSNFLPGHLSTKQPWLNSMAQPDLLTLLSSPSDHRLFLLTFRRFSSAATTYPKELLLILFLFVSWFSLSQRKAMTSYLEGQAQLSSKVSDPIPTPLLLCVERPTLGKSGVSARSRVWLPGVYSQFLSLKVSESKVRRHCQLYFSRGYSSLLATEVAGMQI